MTQLTIQEYTPEYKEAIIQLILEIQQQEFSIPITREDQPDLNNIPQFYQSGAGNFWIALHDHRVVGTIALIDIGNQQAALRKMFVKPDYRGPAHRTAASLLHNLQAWAERHHIGEIYLGTTEKFLAAHRFYEKNGFRQIAKGDLPPAFPVMKVDTRFYALSLAEHRMAR